MRVGELPLELIRMKAKGCNVILRDNEPGFTLPSNIGELGDGIAELDLSYCSLHGARVLNQTYTKSELRSESRCARASSRSSSSA